MTDETTDARAAPDCPECGQEGMGSRDPDRYYCPDCDLTFDADGNTDVRQVDQRPRSEFQPPR